MKMNRAALLRGAAAAAGGALWPAYARAADATIRVASSPSATQAQAFYAERLGLFHSAGISSVLTKVTRGAESIAAVANGSIDVGIATPEIVGNAIIHGLPIRMIASGPIFIEPAPIGLYALKSGPVSDAASLKNAVVGVAALNDNLTLAVWAWLARGGIDKDSVRSIEMPFPTMVPALERGNVQVVTLVEPFITPNIAEIRLIPGVFETLGVGNALGVWFARKDFVRDNADLVKRFTGAIYAVARWAKSTPDAVAPLLAEYSSVPLDIARAMIKPRYAESTDASQFTLQLDEAVKFGMIPRALPFSELMGA
jgi:NitT/TauT family transport system substrate-binding protein